MDPVPTMAETQHRLASASIVPSLKGTLQFSSRRHTHTIPGRNSSPINSAELGAAIVVLAALLVLPKLPYKEIIVRPGSNYVLSLAEGTRQPKHNQTQANFVVVLIATFCDVSMHWRVA